MKIAYQSNKRQLVITLNLSTPKKNKLRIVAYDSTRRNTKYLDRYHEFEGDQKFVIRLPQSPEKITIEVVSLYGRPFNVVSKDVVALRTQMDAWDFGNKEISKFVIFSQKFAERSGYLSPGKYLDDTGTYEITYLARIVSEQTRKELNTPARINAKTGIVQVSARIFRKYTIPGRMAILLHEFCHVFANNDVHSEIEADFHAAQIYCALGYPRVELLNVFANVFYRADTDLNRLRLQKLTQFVNEFDNRVTQVKYGI